MALLDHNGESEFPMNKNQVFDAMSIAIPTIKGMKIESSDKLQGRILVKAGVSLYSWGENIPIQLLGIDENKTKVQITSSPKTGIMFGGAFDMGKNRKNIETILSATSNILQQNINQQPSQQNLSSNYQTTQTQPTQNFSNITTTNQSTEHPKKKMGIGKKLLIGLGALILLIIIANSGKEEKSNAATATPTEQPPSTSTTNSDATTTTPASVDKEQQEQDAIKDKLKAKAKIDWPDDYTTQEYWVNEQIEAYAYMKTIPNGSVKKKAQKDWPLDFTTQKYWYNEQVEAQERMK